jgi:hypothetical protein
MADIIFKVDYYGFLFQHLTFLYPLPLTKKIVALLASYKNNFVEIAGFDPVQGKHSIAQYKLHVI